MFKKFLSKTFKKFTPLCLKILKNEAHLSTISRPRSSAKEDKAIYFILLILINFVVIIYSLSLFNIFPVSKVYAQVCDPVSCRGDPNNCILSGIFGDACAIGICIANNCVNVCSPCIGTPQGGTVPPDQGYVDWDCAAQNWFAITNYYCDASNNIRVEVDYKLNDAASMSLYVHDVTTDPAFTLSNRVCRYGSIDSDTQSWNSRSCGTLYSTRQTVGSDPVTWRTGVVIEQSNVSFNSGITERGPYNVEVRLVGSIVKSCKYQVDCRVGQYGTNKPVVKLISTGTDCGTVGAGLAYHVNPASPTYTCDGSGSFDLNYQIVKELAAAPPIIADVTARYWEGASTLKRFCHVGSVGCLGDNNSSGSFLGCQCTLSPGIDVNATTNMVFRGDTKNTDPNRGVYTFKGSPGKSYRVMVTADKAEGSCAKKEWTEAFSCGPSAVTIQGSFDIARCGQEPAKPDELKGWACQTGNPGYAVQVNICANAPCGSPGSISLGQVLANRNRKIDPDYVNVSPPGYSSDAIEDGIITGCGGLGGKPGVGWTLGAAALAPIRDGNPHLLYAHPTDSNGAEQSPTTYFYQDSDGGPDQPPSTIPVAGPPYYASATPYAMTCPLQPSRKIVRIFYDPDWDWSTPGDDSPAPAAVTLVNINTGTTYIRASATQHIFDVPAGNYRVDVQIPSGWFYTPTVSSPSPLIGPAIHSFSETLPPGGIVTNNVYLGLVPSGYLNVDACNYPPGDTNVRFRYDYAPSAILCKNNTVFAWLGQGLDHVQPDFLTDIPVTYSLRAPYWPFRVDCLGAFEIAPPVTRACTNVCPQGAPSSLAPPNGTTLACGTPSRILSWSSVTYASGYRVTVRGNAPVPPAPPTLPGGTPCAITAPDTFCVEATVLAPGTSVSLGNITPGPYTYRWTVQALSTFPLVCPQPVSPEATFTSPICTFNITGFVYQDTLSNACGSGFTGVGNERVGVERRPPFTYNPPLPLGPISRTTGDGVSLPLGRYEFINDAFIAAGDSYRVFYQRVNLTSDYRTIAVSINGGPFTPASEAIISPLSATTTINFCVSNVAPWFQTESGDVRFAGAKANKVSGTNFASDSPNPSIFFSTDQLLTIPAGRISSTGWIVQDENFYNSPLDTLGGLSYGYFVNLIQKRKIEAPGPPENRPCPGFVCNFIAAVALNGIYKINDLAPGGTYTFTNTVNPTTITFGSNNKVVLLVNGDVIIDRNISVPSGSLLIIAASGNITIASNVGATLPGDTTRHIQGILTAQGSIIIQKRSDQDCFPTSPNPVIPDRRLNIEGSVIANALNPFSSTGGGKFDNQRSLCPANDAQYPSVKIFNRFDFIPLLDDQLKTKESRWQEVRP